MTRRIEWMSVLAFVLAVVGVVGVFVGWIDIDQGTVLLGGAIVTAVLSLRGR